MKRYFCGLGKLYFDLIEYLKMFYIWNLKETQVYFSSAISSKFLNSLKILGGY